MFTQMEPCMLLKVGTHAFAGCSGLLEASREVCLCVCVCGFNQLAEGKLWFQLACGLAGGPGSGPGMMSIPGSRVSDGSWHTLVLELNRNFSSLTLDSRYAEGSRGPPLTRPLAAATSIYFGALVRGWTLLLLYRSRS